MNIEAITNTMKGIYFEMREDGCECDICEFCEARILLAEATKKLDRHNNVQHTQKVQSFSHVKETAHEN